MTDKSVHGTERPGRPIPWEKLTDSEQRNFARMLSSRFAVSLEVDEAAEYYGNPEKLKGELGDPTEGRGEGPQCPECFSPFCKADIPHLKQTGKCPNCGEVLVS